MSAVDEGVDSQATAKLAMRAVGARGTLRARQAPRFFQYEVLHAPFG